MRLMRRCVYPLGWSDLVHRTWWDYLQPLCCAFGAHACNDVSIYLGQGRHEVRCLGCELVEIEHAYID